MTRLHHPLSAFILSLLLVGMQLGGGLHALEHFGEALKQTSDHSFAIPHDEVCPICALFAGGANAATGEIDSATSAVTAATNPLVAPTSITTPAPSYYSSRAPPSFH